MKIGIFGGTFNPVHKGHKNALKTVIENFGLDRVIVLPDRIPPHKQAVDLVDGEDRMNMCKLALGDLPCVEFSDYELKKEGKSYSVYTLRHFHSIYPEDRLCFIMGSDMLLSFTQWYEYKEILSLACLVCVSRSDDDTDKMEPYARKLRDEGGDVVIVRTEPFEVSSTQIRDMLKKKSDCTCYLDENVVQYILDKKLY